MTFWRFGDPGALPGVELFPTYQHELGWLAGLLTLVAAYTMFPAIERVRQARSPALRWLWLTSGALAVGLGFWGVEGMARLGLHLPGFRGHDWRFDPPSLLAAIAAAAFAIRVLSAPQSGSGRLHAGALLLALGVGATHYLGMEALITQARMVYSLPAFLLSFVVGYALTLAALYGNLLLVKRLGNRAVSRLLGTVLLAGAALGIHLATLPATHFYGNPALLLAPEVVTLPALIPAIVLTVLIGVGIFWFFSLIEARLGGAIRALQASEARHRAMIDTMLDAHVVADREGRIRSFNPAAEQMFGCTTAEVLGQPLTVLINPLRRDQFLQQFRPQKDRAPLAAAHRRVVLSAGGCRRDGTVFPAEIAYSEFDVAGTQFFNCVVRDLTEQWATEARVKRLATALEHAPQAIGIIDADGITEYVNPYYEVQTGYRREEVLGKRPARGVESPESYKPMWAKLRNGENWTGVLRVRNKDGAIYEELTTMAPVFDDEGKITHFVAIMRDITLRRATEEKLKFLAVAMDHAVDSIHILDKDGFLVYGNRAWERQSGQGLADAVGQRPSNRNLMDPQGRSLRDMIQTTQRGEAWSGVLRTKTANGGVREDEVTISPIHDEKLQAISYVIVSRDVTEKIGLEDQLRRAQKLESIGQLAAGIAHEINTPTQYVGDNIRFLQESFNEVDGLLQKLQELAGSGSAVPAETLAAALKDADLEFLREEIPKAIEQSTDGCQRISRIVSAMKEFSHPSQDKTPVDLNRAIQSTVTVASNEWKYVANLEMKLDPQLPAVVCLPGEFNQVILNMIVNAAHAIGDVVGDGGKGKGTITVSTRKLEDAAEIRIADTGSGIPAEIRDRIFDPFFTTKQVGKGTGQGLALAHNVVVHQHGGTIGVESEVGKGTCFIIRLPLDLSVQKSAIAA